METAKVTEQSDVQKQKKELLQLLLAKTGVSYKKMIDSSIKDFIFYNLDVLTPTEKKRFNKLVL